MGLRMPSASVLVAKIRDDSPVVAPEDPVEVRKDNELGRDSKLTGPHAE